VDAVRSNRHARTWKAIGHADALLLIVDARIGVNPQPIGPSSTGLPGKLKPVTVSTK